MAAVQSPGACMHSARSAESLCFTSFVPQLGASLQRRVSLAHRPHGPARQRHGVRCTADLQDSAPEPHVGSVQTGPRVSTALQRWGQKRKLMGPKRQDVIAPLPELNKEDSLFLSLEDAQQDEGGTLKPTWAPPATRSSSPEGKKGSVALNRWAMIRRSRSALFPDLPRLYPPKESEGATPTTSPRASALSPERVERQPADGAASKGSVVSSAKGAGAADGPGPKGPFKEVYMVSDSTGWTVDHLVQCAMNQFEHCLVDSGSGCHVETHLFSQVTDVDHLMEIVRTAGDDNALLLFTLADPEMRAAAEEACTCHDVPFVDLLGPVVKMLGHHLGFAPLGLPRGAPGRTSQLTRAYFKRIEAVEFTIKQDDGALTKNLDKADLVLLGVSRTGKTPLSIYMAHKGYKVANIPLVAGIPPPKELFEVDQDRVFGLTINPNTLKSIRTERSRHLGVSTDSRRQIKYGDISHVKMELEFSRQLYLANPRWAVVEVTGRAVEETAAVILRMFHEKQSKHSIPRISRRY